MKHSDYIESIRYKPFEWGKWDCVHYVIDYLYNVKGVENLTEYSPYSSEGGAKREFTRLKKSHNIDSITEVLDTLFHPIYYVGPTGSIVAKRDTGATTGYTIGIVEADKGIFVGYDGLHYLKIDPKNDRFWLT